MARILLELGQRFGSWSITAGPLKHTYPSGQWHYVWDLQCDCGAVKRMNTQALRLRDPSCPCTRLTKPAARLPMAGRQFGDLVVLAEAEYRGHGRVWWRCRCVCGLESVVDGASLRRGSARSCGCLRLRKPSRRKHGYACNPGGRVAPEYQAWRGMKTRCLNPRCRKYPDYGGRGIRVCPEWLDSFEAFLEHIGPRPGQGWSVDRIDVDGHYEPGNVRWATAKQQAQNRRPRATRAHPISARAG